MAPYFLTRIRKSLFRMQTGAIIAALLIMQFLLTAFIPAETARAQTATLSSGCAALNDATYDGVYSGAFAGTLSFRAGESISLTVAEPQTGLPTEIRFEINFATAQAVAYPGTLVYPISTDITFAGSWTLDNGSASWLVSCGPSGDSITTTPTPTNTPTATPCVGQGANHVDMASDRGTERRCDRGANPEKEQKGKRHDR